MAGTGLPIPQNGVLAQSPGIVDGDRYSSAGAWLQVARAGAQLTDIGQQEQQVILAGKLAEAETEARRKRIELEQANQFNPAGFDAAWKGYTEGTLSAATPGMVPHMRRVLAGEGTAAFSSLSNQKMAQDRGLAGQSLTARRQAAQQDVLSLAAGGRVGTPEFDNALATLDGIDATMINGQFVSSDEAKFDKDSLLQKANGEAILFNADGDYASLGYEKALQHVDERLKDPKSGLSPTEQRSYFDKVKSRLGVREAARRDDLKEVRVLAAPVEKLLREGATGLEGDGEQIAKRFEELGSPSDAARVRNAIQFNQGFQGAVSQPTRDWTMPGVVDRIVGVESGGVATAKNPNSSATGAGQFIESTWLATVRAHRPDLMQGRTAQQVLALRNDPALSREMVGHLARDNAEFLTNSGVPVRDGTVYLAHFAGPRGAVQLLKAAPGTPVEQVLGPDAVSANGFLRGKTAAEVVAWADKKMGGAAAAVVDPALLAGRRAGAQKVFDDWAPKAKVGFMRWGFGPQDAEFIAGIAPYLDERRRGDLRDMLTSAELSTQMMQMPPAERDSLLGSLEGKAATGDVAARKALEEAEEVHTNLAKREKEDPLGRATGAGWVQGPTNIDWSRDQAGTTEQLQARARDARVTAEMIGAPVIPALRDGEARALASQMTTGDSRLAMPTVVALQSSLNPDQFMATMALPTVQTALGQMVRTGDVARMSAAFSVYDALYRQNPAEFEARFGAAALDKLQDWQGKLQFYGAKEIAEEMRRAEDPAAIQAREKLRKEGDKLVTDVTARDVAGKFGGWFSSPGLSSDQVQNEAMAAEYRTLYAQRYASTGDAALAEQQAVERLGNKWGPSPINGGRLTARPPERYYPAVQGSHDWMTRQLEDGLRQALGLSLGAPSAISGTEAETYLPQQGRAAALPAYQLMTDTGTEADIAAGRPPSYVVSITDAQGRLKVVEDAQGRPMRFAWDRDAAREEGRAWFRGAQRFMGNVREGQALDAELNGGVRWEARP